MSDKATLHDDKNYKVTLKASKHKVLGKQLQVESMAGDRNGLGGSQKGEVVWLSDNYTIALHMSINQFAESFSALTPSEPTDVTCEQKEGRTVITFKPPATTAGTTHYIASCSAFDSGDVLQAQEQEIGAADVGSSITITCLVAGYLNTIALYAVNSAGRGLPAVVAQDAATPPTAPISVLAKRGDGEATVTFAPPAGDGGSAIVKYTAITSPGGITASCDGSGRSVVLVGLSNGITYTVLVRAVNGMGESAAGESNAFCVTIPDLPTEIVATRGDSSATGRTTFHMTWLLPRCI